MLARRKPMIKWYGKLFYGCGNLGYGLISQTMSSFILFFGTTVVSPAVSPTLMGLAVAIGTMWDALTDPICGVWSDRTRSTLFGRRHGFILFATLGMAVVNLMLWNVPTALGSFSKFIWFTVFIVLLEAMNTLFATPYTALGIELSGDYQEQTVIQSYKSIFFLLGMVVPTVLMAFLQMNPQSGVTDGRLDIFSYQNMAYISSSLALLCGVICFVGTYSHLPRLKAKDKLLTGGIAPKKKSFKEIIVNFFSMFKNRNYAAVVIGYAISLMAGAFLIGAGLHMFTFSFKISTMQMYMLMGGLFAMTILFQPLWVYLSSKWGKKKALIFGMIIAIVGAVYVGLVFLFRGFVPSTNNIMALLFPAVIIVGIGTGAMYSLPISMLGDVVAYQNVHSEDDRTATYSGWMTLAYKVSQSLAVLVIGILIDVIGFNADKIGGDIANVAPVVEWGLGAIVIFGVLISLIGGIIAYSKFNLKREDIPSLHDVHTPNFGGGTFPTEVDIKEMAKKEFDYLKQHVDEVNKNDDDTTPHNFQDHNDEE